MAVIAVAGGTGHLGRIIVEAIKAKKKNDVIVLSRKPNPGFEAELDVKVVPLDYSDIPALTQALEKHNVHTVISTVAFGSSPTGETSKEVELIRAADASTATKRMVSSFWGGAYDEDQTSEDATADPLFGVRQELKKTTSLETTFVVNGVLLDYWGFPAVKTYMPPMTLVLDIPNKAAAIPGDGNAPVVFTHTRDVAKFVAALLDLENWDPVSYIVGDRLTWNEFLAAAEDVTGTSFNVTYDSEEKLARGEVTELPGQVAAYAFFPKAALQDLASKFGLRFAQGKLNWHREKTLNDTFPEIETLKAREMLRLAW